MSEIQENISATKSKIKHPVHSNFEYSETLNKSTCKECGESKKGRHASNLLRHLKSRHPRIHKELNVDCEKYLEKRATPRETAKKKTVTVTYNLEDLMKSLVCWVTVDIRPFSIIEDVGTRGFLQPIFDACQRTGADFSVNRQNLPDICGQFELKFINQITKEVKNKLISVQMDVQSDDER